MGATGRTAVASGLAVLAVLAAGGCGNGGARYVESPASTSWDVGAAAVDRAGTVVLTGEGHAVTVAPVGTSDVVPYAVFEAPDAVTDDDPRGVLVDGARAAWVLFGDRRVPVRVADGEVHAAGPVLEQFGRRAGIEALPGVVPDMSRATTAVAVVDGATAVVGSYASVGTSRARGNVLVHRVGTTGAPALLAGRPWTGSPDRPAPATDLEPGRSAPATAVDLDDVVALQPLAGAGLLVVTAVPTDASPGLLTFFRLDGAELTRLATPEAHVRTSDGPGVTTSLTAAGRVIANVSVRGGGPSDPVALSIDPATGEAPVVDSGGSAAEGAGPLLTADADGGGLVAVTPPGADPEDEDNVGYVRIVPVPAPIG